MQRSIVLWVEMDLTSMQQMLLPSAVLREYPAEVAKADDIETAALDATEGEMPVWKRMRQSQS
jgi:hypothetical protein